MAYVLKDTRHGNYVARPGSRSSFTPKLQDARVYPTKESAERDRCPESEVAVCVEDEMGR